MTLPHKFAAVPLSCLGLFTLSLAACTGNVGEGGSQDAPSPSGGAGKGGQGVARNPEGVSSGPLPFRRLTRLELNNTMADLLGDRSNPAATLPADVRGESGFLKGNAVSTVDADRLSEMADQVATAAAGRLDQLTGCAPSLAAEDCANKFISTFGSRVFRRPLEPDELTEYKAFAGKLRTEVGLDPKTALTFVLRALLQSPNFLYHWTVAPRGTPLDGGLVRVRGYELASRLSFFLWQSMPDDVLFKAAAEQKLETPSDAAREARRMLQHPRAKATVLDFYRQWLNIADVSTVRKAMDFPLATGEAAAVELNAFIDYVVFGEGRGSLTALLTSPVSFPSASLSKLYGTQASASGAQAKLDSEQRSGILTRVGFLALNGKGGESDPIHRGIAVLEKLLCEHTPPPMPSIPPLAPPSPTLSTRERNLEHQSNPSCAACHSRFEPLGYAFEHYDGLGRYRSRDGGKAVNASADFTSADGEMFKFDNAVELSQLLARSPQVQRCAANQAFRFATGRMEDEADDSATKAVFGAYTKSSLDAKELLVAVASSSSFMFRAPAQGEVLQ